MALKYKVVAVLATSCSLFILFKIGVNNVLFIRGVEAFAFIRVYLCGRAL